MPKTTRHRFVGAHADDLASGQQVHPGEFVNLDADAVKVNAPMIERGALIAVPDKDSSEAEPTKPRSNRKATTTKEG